MPTRLELGDPVSIAWARTQESELARRDELRRHDEARARRSAGQRRRLERQRDTYPPEEVVVTAIRAEVWDDDWGLPPKRRRLAERALEELRRSYPSVPMEHVQTVFDRAVEAGRLRRAGRQWSWEPPSTGGRRQANTAIARAILEHTILLRAGGMALGLGTLVGHENTAAVATTQGVLDDLNAMDAPLDVVAKRGAVVQVDRELVGVEVLGSRLPNTESALGPDLAILTFPRIGLEQLLAAGKRCFGDNEGVLAEGRVLAIAGSPVVARTPLLRVTLQARFRESLEGISVDYLDIERQVRGGWLPGAGVWSAFLDGAGAWHGALEFEGVAFREDDGRIRAHGRQVLRHLLLKCDGRHG